MTSTTVTLDRLYWQKNFQIYKAIFICKTNLNCEKNFEKGKIISKLWNNFSSEFVIRKFQYYFSYIMFNLKKSICCNKFTAATSQMYLPYFYWISPCMESNLLQTTHTYKLKILFTLSLLNLCIGLLRQFPTLSTYTISYQDH